MAKIMAWVVKGKKEGVFTESKTVRKRQLLNGNTIALIKNL